MIQALTPEFVDSAARLHREVLGETTNSKIGLWFIKRLYMIVGKAPDNGFCFVYVDNGAVCGIISFCLDRAKLDKSIASSLNMREKVRIAASLLLHPWLLRTFLHQRLFSRYLDTALASPSAYILTLGVSPTKQGEGIGSKLMDIAKEIAREHGHKELVVDTE